MKFNRIFTRAQLPPSRTYPGEVAYCSDAASAKAAYTTSLTGTHNDVTLTARSPGVGGNAITIAYVDPAVPGAPLGVVVTGKAIAVNLGTVAAVAASLSTNLAGANNDITLTAKSAGTGGNVITLALTNPGSAAANEIVSVTSNAISVALAHNGSAIVSTAQTVVNAINAATASSLLVTAAVKNGDTGAGVVTALAATNLTGGVAGGAINSTATQVRNAIAANLASHALVSVANHTANDGSGVVTALAATNLTGGTDAPAAVISDGVNWRTITVGAAI